MGDILSTGLSGLMAFRRALDTTSHNISNSNTDGYVRQRVDIAARPAQPVASGWVGNGADVQTIRRVYDQFLVNATRTSSTSLERLNVMASQTDKINNMFADPSTGLSATLQKFANSLQAVSAQPTSIPARQVLLGDSQAMVDQLQSFDAQLRNLETDATARITADVTEINALAQGIARMNADIASGWASTGQPPNDLLDQRDAMLDKLASKINISTVPQDQGVLNVFVGKGQALVLSSTASQLGTQVDSFDPTRPRVMLQGAQGQSDITSSISGGSLGGVLDFRNEVLDPTRNSLGQIAVGLADVINSQHRMGMDLSGAMGTDLFGVGGATALASSSNTGTAGVTVTRSNVAGMTTADYHLSYDGTNWSMRRLDNGATVALSGAGTVASPFVADGLSMVISTPAGAVAGDRFLIRPTRDAVNGMSTLITDAGRFAAAAPITASRNTSNTGGGTISAGEVLDPTNAQLRSTVNIQFLTASTYSVNGAGSFAYTAGQPIDLNGWRVTISGAPAVGDQFSVRDNSSGIGDNRNVLALGRSLNTPRLENSTTSVNAATARLAGTVGHFAQQSQVNRDAQQIMQDDSITLRQNAMGVNLDEEAANLIRYQQAYQAAAQLIKVANQMFDAVLAATR